MTMPQISKSLFSLARTEEADKEVATRALARVRQWQEAFTHPDQIEECQILLEAWTGKRAQLCWSSAQGLVCAHLGSFEGVDGPPPLRADADTYEEAIIHLVEHVYRLAAPLVEQAVQREWEQWWDETGETSSSPHAHRGDATPRTVSPSPCLSEKTG